MGYEEDGLALLLEVFKLLEALGLEEYITYRQRFIDDQDLRVDIDGYRESKANQHTGRIGLHRLVDEVTDVCKGEDIVKSLVDLFLGKSTHGSIQVDILDSCVLGIEAGTQFQKSRDSAFDLNLTAGRIQDSGDDLQDGRLTGTVGTNDTNRLTLLDVEGDSIQSIVLLISLLLGRD